MHANMHNHDVWWLCRYLYARASACTATMSYVGHASYGRVQTAPKVRVCAAVLRETYLHACPRVQKFTLRNTATRSTKTTIMYVHANTIMQTVLSQRRIISISEARNFSLSESDGGLISSSNRVHGPRNCSQEGSQTASCFAVQFDRDGR